MTESIAGDDQGRERDSVTARKSLDRHGRGFHYAAIDKQQLHEALRSTLTAEQQPFWTGKVTSY